MSRLGKKPIAVPDKTEVSFSDGQLNVKGPQGQLQRAFKNIISIKIEDLENGQQISLQPKSQNKQSLALWGTYASHIKNMINGVNAPYQKKLIIEGVGFKSEVKANKLVMSLGFSHPVEVVVPEGINVSVEKNIITISGIDKELLGQFAARVRSKKKPEPYKGKGIRYENEIIRRKQGKKSA